jgi:hypothetical protein
MTSSNHLDMIANLGSRSAVINADDIEAPYGGLLYRAIIVS